MFVSLTTCDLGEKQFRSLSMREIVTSRPSTYQVSGQHCFPRQDATRFRHVTALVKTRKELVTMVYVPPRVSVTPLLWGRVVDPFVGVFSLTFGLGGVLKIVKGSKFSVCEREGGRGLHMNASISRKICQNCAIFGIIYDRKPENPKFFSRAPPARTRTQ